jgi:hypothetical protein
MTMDVKQRGGAATSKGIAALAAVVLTLGLGLFAQSSCTGGGTKTPGSQPLQPVNTPPADPPPGDPPPSDPPPSDPPPSDPTPMPPT